MDKCADLWFGNSDTIAHIWLTLGPLALGGYVGYQLFIFGAKIYLRKALMPVEATISKVENIEGKPKRKKIIYRYVIDDKKYKACEVRHVEDDDETYKARKKIEIHIYRKHPAQFYDKQFENMLKGIAVGVGVLFAAAFFGIATALAQQHCI